jgi:hypothetical protein
MVNKLEFLIYNQSYYKSIPLLKSRILGAMNDKSIWNFFMLLHFTLLCFMLYALHFYALHFYALHFYAFMLYAFTFYAFTFLHFYIFMLCFYVFTLLPFLTNYFIIILATKKRKLVCCPSERSVFVRGNDFSNISYRQLKETIMRYSIIDHSKT